MTPPSDEIDSLIVSASEAVARGRWPDAIAAAEQVLAIDPEDPEGLLLLGIAHAGAGDLDVARASLERAVRLDPEHAQAWTSLAEVCRGLDELREAAEAALRAWRCDTKDLGLARRAASALAAVGRLDEAVPPATRLAEAGDVADRLRLVELFVAIDRGEEATALLEEIERNHGCDPGVMALHRAEASLPLVTESAEAADAAASDFDAALARSAANAPAFGDPADAVLPPWPFRLPALAEPNPARARRHAELASHVAVAALGRPKPAPSRPSGAGRLRIGLLSGLWRDHVVARLLLDGWTRHLDRDRFEVVAIDVGRSVDEYGRSLQARCDRTLHATSLGERPRDVAAGIGDAGFDILLLPELGMAPLVPQLAALRLAPLQAVAWGHPETTGLSTIDLFLSSDAMEPADGDRHYTERLVRLPGLGATVARPVFPPPADRATFAWPDDAIVCWCAQTPHKHAPQFDRLYAQVAEAVPSSRFVFTAPQASVSRARLEQRLRRAFTAAGADPARQLEFLPVLPTAEFRSRLAAADLFLDPPGWSGGHTTLEAVAAGRPVVTLPGDFMRRRHALGILRTLDPDGAWSTPLIAESPEAYVASAIALATDRSRRLAIADSVAACAHRCFDDPAPIRALEGVLLEAAGR